MENRLAKLRTFSVAHVDGIDNPADLASRGAMPSDIQSNKKWFHGPEWLSLPESEWPEPKFTFKPGEEKVTEDPPFFEACATVVEANQLKLINTARFSNIDRLKRTMVYVLRYIKLRIVGKVARVNQLTQMFVDIQLQGPITCRELKIAERYLIKDCQQQYKPDITAIRNLGLYQDDSGLWRSRGRLHHAGEMTSDAMYPIYLPKQADLPRLILRDIHLRMKHAGTNIIAAEYRQRFWTPALRRIITHTLINNPLTKCAGCYRYRAKALQAPPEPPLPPERVMATPPFMHCGVDYFGPMYIRQDKASQKVWGCLFTCLAIRASTSKSYLIAPHKSF